MHNGRPISARKAVQMLVALTLLAWATQTLFNQWGFGQTMPVAGWQEEAFVPKHAEAASATLELRAEATIIGQDVKLKQVGRWEAREEAVFSPVADLVLFRLSENAPFRSISAQDLKELLADAGVNLAVIRLAGSTSCTVTRSDVRFDEQQALEAWINAKNDALVAAPTTAPSDSGALVSAPQAVETVTDDDAVSDAKDDRPFATLRQRLNEDLCVRLAVDAQSLQLTFSPADEKVLSLAEPHFKFEITPQRTNNLGDVRWDVLIVTSDGKQKATIKATARQWQNQVIVEKPVSYKQIIRDEDVSERRVLADRLSDDPLLRLEQVIGQQAGRDLKPGAIVTARYVDAPPLVRAGQLITVTLKSGNINIKTVAKAMEGGSFGQTIKARNEATKDIFEVVFTGPQEATMGGDSPTIASVERE